LKGCFLCLGMRVLVVESECMQSTCLPHWERDEGGFVCGLTASVPNRLNFVAIWQTRVILLGHYWRENDNRRSFFVA